MSRQSYADDCERILRILMDAPPGGLSLDEIIAVTSKSDDPWSSRTVNSLLCDLSPQVACVKARVRNRKVSKYELKNRS